MREICEKRVKIVAFERFGAPTPKNVGHVTYVMDSHETQIRRRFRKSGTEFVMVHFERFKLWVNGTLVCYNFELGVICSLAAEVRTRRRVRAD